MGHLVYDPLGPSTNLTPILTLNHTIGVMTKVSFWCEGPTSSFQQNKWSLILA